MFVFVFVFVFVGARSDANCSKMGKGSDVGAFSHRCKLSFFLLFFLINFLFIVCFRIVSLSLSR